MKTRPSLRCPISAHCGWALLVLVAFAGAEPLPTAARAEVDALLARLSASGCEFQRNGKWHDAPRAVAHLRRKLAYLEEKGLVRTTEQFIELGASSSSSSGKPYFVRCGSRAPVQSRQWLEDMLGSIRRNEPAQGQEKR